jgi:hypothetical protein
MATRSDQGSSSPSSPDDFSIGLAKMAADNEGCEQEFSAIFAIFDGVCSNTGGRGAWRGHRSASVILLADMTAMPADCQQSC